MRQPEQPSPGWHPIRDAKVALSMLVFAGRTIAYPVELFLHTGMGSQAAGLHAGVAFLLLPLWPGCYHHADPRPLLGFWVLAIVMQICARIETTRMLARGEVLHSRYNGWPRLSRVFKRASEMRIKGIYEPVFVFLAGGMLLDANQPLGEYLIAAAVALMFNAGIGEMVEHARAREMTDAMLDQQLLADRVRAMTERRR